MGAPATQNELLSALRAHVTDPLGETVEFLRRDVLNLALRNTDNHPRHTAVQRLADDRVQLTPLFDFAPMYFDPEVEPRTVHWRDRAGNRLDGWSLVLESLPLSEAERVVITVRMREFSETVGRLPDIACNCGVDAVVLDDCRASIDAQAEDLANLSRS